MSKPQQKPSALKREHPEIQNMKFLNFFLFLWVTFALLDPDPDTDPLTWLIPDPIRIRNTATNRYRGTGTVNVVSEAAFKSPTVDGSTCS